MRLDDYDVHFCIKRLPRRLKELMIRRGDEIIVAGGFIRAVIANERMSDIDVFAGDRRASKELAMELVNTKGDLYETDNAITVKNLYIPVQFIHKWVYTNPLDVLQSFDFSICQAAIWYNKEEKKWSSQCEDNFYPDLAAKRLAYLSPVRNEDAGGSILRVLKYYQWGYRIPLDSFGLVLARLLNAVRDEGYMDEANMAQIITGLLIEVDPAGFIDHEAYLPVKGGK